MSQLHGAVSIAGLGCASEQPSVPVFEPEVFEVESVEQAMRLIASPEPDATTEERWEKETPWLIDDIGRCLAIDANCRLLDYGCRHRPDCRNR